MARIRPEVVKRAPNRMARRQITRLGRVSLLHSELYPFILGGSVGTMVTLALIVGLNALTYKRKG